MNRAPTAGRRGDRIATDLVMYDSIDVSQLVWAAQNVHVDALAGYVAGSWPTWSQVEAMAAKLTGIRLLSISPFAANDADCLDVEPGDATNAQVYGWFKRQQARGAWKPCVYTSAGNAAALDATMTANGFPRSSWRLWSAHYTGIAHICGPHTCGYPQADGTQWTDKAHGRNLDQSLLSPGFFQAAPKPPAPKPPAPSPVSQPLEADVFVLPELTSTGPAISLPVPAGKTKITFYADPGYRTQTAVALRVACTPNFRQVTLTPSFGHPAPFALAPGTTEVTVARTDTGAVPVTISWG